LSESTVVVLSETNTAHHQAQPIDETADKPSFRVITIGMVALVGLIAFQALAVTTAMPAVARALDGLSLYAMAFAAPLASGVVGMVVAGIWSDRSGPAGTLWTGVALFAASLIVTGFAPSMSVVVVSRLVLGLGSGMMIVALYVVIARVYPEALQPQVFASFSAAWVVPAIVGPTIAGFMVEHVGWRWVFLSVPFLVIPASLLIRPALRQIPPREDHEPGKQPTRQERTRVLWAVGAAVSAAMLHYGGQERGILAVVLIGGALAGLAITAPKLLPIGTLRARRGLPTVIVLRGLIGASFFAAEIFVPLLLSRERGFSAAMAGAILTIGGVTWFLGSWIRGRPNWSIAPTTFLRVGAGSVAIGIASVTALTWPEVPALVGVLGWSFAGFGMGMVYPTLSILTLKYSAPAEEGSNSSALQVSESLAAATVLALTGSIFALLALSSTTAAYLACFVTAGALAVVAAYLAPRAGSE
jgi:MFS family permease